MKRALISAAIALNALFANASFADGPPLRVQTRCGWFVNPSPANVWLEDRDGEWTVGIQGGHQAEGDWPVFKRSQWIKTNREYGYGCACMQVVADPNTREIITIYSAHAKSLSACRDDHSLKAPE